MRPETSVGPMMALFKSSDRNSDDMAAYSWATILRPVLHPPHNSRQGRKAKSHR